MCLDWTILKSQDELGQVLVGSCLQWFPHYKCVLIWSGIISNWVCESWFKFYPQRWSSLTCDMTRLTCVTCENMCHMWEHVSHVRTYVTCENMCHMWERVTCENICNMWEHVSHVRTCVTSENMSYMSYDLNHMSWLQLIQTYYTTLSNNSFGIIQNWTVFIKIPFKLSHVRTFVTWNITCDMTFLTGHVTWRVFNWFRHVEQLYRTIRLVLFSNEQNTLSNWKHCLEWPSAENMVWNDLVENVVWNGPAGTWYHICNVMYIRISSWIGCGDSAPCSQSSGIRADIIEFLVNSSDS